MDYRTVYQTGIEQLERAGIAEAKLDARLLLEYACDTDHSTLFAHPDREVSDKELEAYRELLARREQREPVAYILGNWDFMGLTFRVNSDVLIPEQDSELLVEEAMRFCEDGMKVLDLCTGSGCIGLSLLRFTNYTNLVATDISAKALDVARSNAESLGLSDRATFIETDLFPEIPDKDKKYDLILSNPPYIASSVIEGLAPEVRDYEPRIALDGDEDGLAFYRRIVQNAGDYLYSSGYLIMEIGYDQAEAVTGLMEADGRYHDIEVIKDYGGNDRVIRACFY
ncbi:peptide chain release factor N(5)-glutamine methyltransferase [Butyrivibrio sp. DSM 10294]|uniref:peptide chain release factor N(5)-glutamine methyltransferase n=1 Tax=Butyrivibrio sp. DSM 10294 TaxID=2972457 RepID=UPI00234EF9CB|nr:peptide chain release factor N(5)-glutamine methyltransferase [Butyrivibrio sp. DSM 10294]MDC7294110.1 peptide chain release factor N(5)-glutamine methyltransferase [Butyrivibrio sp. DSM 10294]